MIAYVHVLVVISTKGKKSSREASVVAQHGFSGSEKGAECGVTRDKKKGRKNGKKRGSPGLVTMPTPTNETLNKWKCLA